MKLDGFSSGGILRIIFRYINESPRTLAELYVYRDRTLVYKWLHDSATPPKALVPGIVSFVMEKSCEPVRLSIRRELEGYTAASGLEPEIVAQLAGTSPFQKFMEDILHFAISLPAKGPAPAAGTRLGEGRTKEAGQGRTWKGSAIPFAELALGFLAVFGSGILWNGINRLLGWTFYMGGTGREPQGMTAAVWGITLALPLILVAMAARRKAGGEPPRGGRSKAIAITILYSLSGMVGALVFYNSGLRASVEGFHLGYGLQELAIAFAFAFLISLLPSLAIMATCGRGPSRSRVVAALAYTILPPLLVSVVVFLTLFVDRPIAELEQLRGFLAGLMLRTGMYIVARGY